MPIKYVIIREIKSGTTKSNTTYPWVLDQDGVKWNLFPPLPHVEVNKAYAFHYETSGDFNNITKIEPVINIFKAQALKELASSTEIKRDLFMSLSYSKDLVVSKSIELDKMFEWSDKIYQYITSTSEKFLPK